MSNITRPNLVKPKPLTLDLSDTSLPRADTRDLAICLQYKHKVIIESVDKYTKELSSINFLTFKTEEKRGTQGAKTRYALLTEDQCYFVLTLMRNIPKVVEAKLALVVAFKNAREKTPLIKDAAWLKARQDGKITRREETDTIKLFVEYATKQGSRNARMYYMAITKGVYSALYMIEKDTSWKAIRETLGTTDLQVLSTCEHVARKYIQEGMDLNMDYKDIYKYAIAKVEEMAGIIGKKQTLLSVVRDKDML